MNNHDSVGVDLSNAENAVIAREDRPTAIDLFSGCGGLTQGLKQAGFVVLAAIDNDELAVETYQTNHPEVHIWAEDITSLSFSELHDALDISEGDLDLLAGCPPCQGFSRMRTLNSSRVLEDSRNELVFEFARLARSLRPKTLMLENVPGLAEDGVFDEFLQEIQELGYAANHLILDAADYGVPQRRRRLIMMAGLFGPIKFAPPISDHRTVREAIASLPPAGDSGDPLHDVEENRSQRIKDLISKIPEDGRL